MSIVASPRIEKYFKNLKAEVLRTYDIAKKARRLGLDPEQDTEIILANNMAERVIGIISTVAPQLAESNVTQRIQELEKEYGLLDWRVALRIAEEVAKQKFCKFKDKIEAMEMGIRTGFSYLTLGIVAAPLEGFIGLKIKKRKDGKEYFALQYAGPVRGAGGTASSVSVIVSDYVRVKMGYDKWDPSEKEVNRYILEINDYHERVTNLQYRPSNEELKFMLEHLPVEVDGDPTEKIEVSNYKDLPRIETNLIRGGLCLVIAEGLCQKSKKLNKRLAKWGKDMDLEWDFMTDFLKLKEEIHAKSTKEKEEKKAAEAANDTDNKDAKEPVKTKVSKRKFPKANDTFVADIVAGRPVITHPIATGGLRLRYGRGRTSGFSAAAIHPATLVVMNDFFAIGTQCKVERPGKAATLTLCDTIEGPIVRLKDKSIIKLKTQEEAKKYKKQVESIIFLGDILFNYGDFSENGHKLVPAGYCEEWWAKELEKALMQKQNIGNKNDIDFQKAANEINKKNFERNEQSLVSTKSQDAESKILRLETPVSMDKRSGRGHTKNYVRKYPNNIDKETLKNITKIPLYHSPTLDQAINISKIFNIPLHSEYTDYWRLISFQDLELLVEHLNQATYNKENNTISIKYSEENKKCKEILENIGVPHNTITTPTTNAKTESNTKEDQTPIIKNIIIPKTQTNILKFLLNIQNIPNEENKINIQIKEGEYEDALDYFEQNLNIKIKDKAGTFIGARMGRPEKAKMRAMQGRPHMLFPVGEEGGRLRSIQGALKVGYIKSQFNKDWLHKLQEDYGEDIIKVLFNKADEHALVELNIKKLLPKVLKELDMTIYPDLIKGVRGVSNKAKMPENIIKGIYRAKYDIAVNKDGTTRYDATELPLTHFKPKEIETGIEKLKELGYTKDIKGQPLTNDNQLLELLPQDIILPQYEAIEKGCGTIMTNVAKFIDEILVKVYKLPPFYNVKKKEDLVGHLVIGLAPHISAGTVGRIIGFSQTQSILTHPMYHAGLRRDCVHPDTKFLYKTTHNNNNNIHNKEIGPLVENLIKKGQKTSIIDSVGTIKVECDKPYTVFGADPKTKKIVEKKVKYFIKGPSPKYWIKTTLGTRRKVIMTPEHNCLVSNNGKLTKKKAKNLKIGDKIPLALNIPEQKNYKNKLNIIEEFVKHLPNKELSNISIRHEAFFRSLVKEKRDLVKPNVTKKHYQKHLLSEWTKKASLLDIKNLLRNNIISLKDLKEAKLQVKFSKRLFSPEIKLTKDFASLLGYYAAEGYCRKSSTVSQVAFRICEKDLQDEIIRLINSVFNITPNLGEGNTKITICDQLVYNFFKYVLDMGCTAYHKKTPPILWNLKKETMIHFLSAYLDGDGTVDVSRNSVQFYSVSRNLLDGVATQFARFSVFSKYFTTKERLPGKTVLERYNELGKEPKKHVLHHLIITGKDTKTLKKILKLKSKRKRDILSKIKGSNYRRTVCNNKRPIVEVEKDLAYDYIREIEKIEDKQNSYCISVEGESKNTKNFIINSLILSSNCDGDEAAILLLLDGLLNFSKKYLPSSRGSTMDAALVLTAILNPAEVDDQVLGMDVHWEYPLELYEAAEKMLAPWEVKWGKDQKKIEQLDHRLGTVKQYEDFGFTHHIDDFNDGVKCSAYKTLPGMREKLKGQMKLGKKIRAVDENQVARLVIQKHFLADIKGNFRKYSMQSFRCSNCNTKYRRPPVSGKCTECKSLKSKILFTISQGSVVKYLEMSLELCDEYDFSPYLKQTIYLLKQNIDVVFGKAPDKQVGLNTFFK